MIYGDILKMVSRLLLKITRIISLTAHNLQAFIASQTTAAAREEAKSKTLLLSIHPRYEL